MRPFELKPAELEQRIEERDQRIREGRTSFEVVACIDGRGFGVRRNDMRDILRVTHGKTFTLATLDSLVAFTELRRFSPAPPKS